jgi:hypothetical protein
MIVISPGDPYVRSDSATGVAYRDVIPAGRSAMMRAAFAHGPADLAWAIDKIGEFPFSIYGNLAVDQLFDYSLETQGVVVHSYGLFDQGYIPGRIGQEFFYRPIGVREAVHQWFGNSVSPRMWSDICSTRASLRGTRSSTWWTRAGSTNGATGRWRTTCMTSTLRGTSFERRSGLALGDFFSVPVRMGRSKR